MRYHPKDKSSPAMYYRRAQQQIAERDRTFMDIMNGPNPLNATEIAKLIAKDPARYSRYAGFGRKIEPC